MSEYINIFRSTIHLKCVTDLVFMSRIVCNGRIAIK